jgi:hypothetical protein
MKKIIHNKLPMDQYGNSILCDEEIEIIHNTIQDMLGNDYIVITTPTDISLINSDDIIIKIDCKDYTYNDLIALIN